MVRQYLFVLLIIPSLFLAGLLSSHTCFFLGFWFNSRVYHPSLDRELEDVFSLFSLLESIHVPSGRRDPFPCKVSHPHPFEGLSCHSFFLILCDPCHPHFPLFSTLWNVKSLIKQALHGKANIVDHILRHSSILLGLQWCILCNGASEDLEHNLCGWQFAGVIWDFFHSFFNFWRSIAQDKRCSFIMEKILLHPPFSLYSFGHLRVVLTKGNWRILNDVERS